MKKRFLAILLSVAMVCSAGCGDAKDVEQQESSAVETYEASSSAEDGSEESLGGKINSNTDNETFTTGHSTSSSEETDEPFIPSSEWMQMMSDTEY